MRSLLRVIAATGEKIYNLISREIRDLGQSVDILQSRLTHPREKLMQFESARRSYEDRILYCARNQLWESRSRLDAVLARLGAASPATQMGISRQQLSTMNRLLLLGVKNACNQRRAHLQTLRGKIDILGPQNTLNRGYALVRAADGDVILDAARVKAGDKVQVQVSRGEFDATVNR
jgi:exodeoxyribonuclease VII large subunit